MFHDNSKSTTVEQYLRKLSGQEKEPEIISVDHNYSKSWSSHSDSNHARPARMLFMKGLPRYPHLNGDQNSEEIDIVSCDEPMASPFDNPKSRHLMTECDRYLKYNPLLDDIEDKEENIQMAGWTSNQRRIYKQVMKVLQMDRLAKLAYTGTSNEPVKRRISIDKTCRRLRQLYGSACWEMKLLNWLHQTLMDNLNTSTLTVYLDALQTLKAKVPNLIDKMLSPMAPRTGPGSMDSLNQLLKRQWDPLQPQLSHHKPRKLPGNPIIVVTPSSPNQQLTGTQRLRFWHNHLSSLGKVVNVPICLANGNSSTTVEDCLDQIITAVRNKVIELKSHYPTRPVILIGWTIGALIACHVALEEEVTAIICLGFPLTGVNGSRGDLDDPLLENRIPTLFIVGQNSNMCSTDDIEDFRSRMKAETGLVIVGGADDLLKVSHMKKKIEGITQAIADRCLVDEISDFLLLVLNVQYPASTSTVSQPSSKYYYTTAVIPEVPEQNLGVEDAKRRRRKPREYSPELSPVRKRMKPNTTRQQTAAPTPKARLSPSSSETSSSGSCTEKSSPVKGAPKKPNEKRVGRPATGTWRKRITIKPLVEPNQNEVKTPVKVIKTDPIKPVAIAMPPLKILPPAVPVPEMKAAKPFPVKILEQKNDPVDVEKAFGRDSSFLPRPLTPPEPEDTVSAEESENAISELEALANSSIISEPPTPVSTTATTTKATSLLSHSFLVDKKVFLPIASKASETPTLITKVTPTVTIEPQKIMPKLSVKEPKLMPAIKTTAGLRTVFPQTKILTTSALQSLRNNNISLVATPQSSAGSPAKTQSFVLTMPSGNTTFLVSSADGHTQQAKMIQLHKMSPKGAPTLVSKPPSLSSLLTSTSTTRETSEPQVCNLSLLSDVAGMTEPIKDLSRKIDKSMATLVKLAPSDGMQPMGVKCLKVIKTVSSPMRVPSPPVRHETPEEMVEKQLAIQALNKSIGIESPSTSSTTRKEAGYSICYAKQDGSIVSRTVPKPNYPLYLPSRGRGRGRGQTVFHSKELGSYAYYGT